MPNNNNNLFRYNAYVALVSLYITVRTTILEMDDYKKFSNWFKFRVNTGLRWTTAHVFDFETQTFSHYAGVDSFKYKYLLFRGNPQALR